MTDVTSTSDLVVKDAEGRQRNGTIFSIESTIFYAKVLASLAINYNAKALEIGIAPDMELSQEIYSEALTQTLTAYCADDVRNYGRMLGLRHILSELMPRKRLNLDHLTCMYAKDISIVRNLDIHDEEFVETILANMPTPEEIEAIILKREKVRRFRN